MRGAGAPVTVALGVLNAPNFEGMLSNINHVN